MGLKSPFYALQAIWDLKCVRERLIQGFVWKTIQACLGGKRCLFIQILPIFDGLCNRSFWDIRLKIQRLLNFNKLFQFLLTNAFKSELFSFLQKVDHVTNYCKKRIMYGQYIKTTTITTLSKDRLYKHRKRSYQKRSK